MYRVCHFIRIPLRHLFRVSNALISSQYLPAQYRASPNLVTDTQYLIYIFKSLSLFFSPLTFSTLIDLLNCSYSPRGNWCKALHQYAAVAFEIIFRAYLRLSSHYLARPWKYDFASYPSSIGVSACCCSISTQFPSFVRAAAQLIIPPMVSFTQRSFARRSRMRVLSCDIKLCNAIARACAQRSRGISARTVFISTAPLRRPRACIRSARERTMWLCAVCARDMLAQKDAL